MKILEEIGLFILMILEDLGKFNFQEKIIIYLYYRCVCRPCRCVVAHRRCRREGQGSRYRSLQCGRRSQCGRTCQAQGRPVYSARRGRQPSCRAESAREVAPLTKLRSVNKNFSIILAHFRGLNRLYRQMGTVSLSKPRPHLPAERDWNLLSVAHHPCRPDGDEVYF